MADEQELNAIIKALDDFVNMLQRSGGAISGDGGALQGSIASVAPEDGYGKRLESLRSYNAAVLKETQRAASAQLAVEADLTRDASYYVAQRRDIQLSALSKTVDDASQLMQSLYSAFGSKNTALFNAMKAASIAEATIKGYQAAVNAYEFGSKTGGPFLGATYAAIALSATAAQIAKIKETSPGSSSSGSSGVSTTSGSTSGDIPSANVQGAEVATAQSITLNIYNPLSEQNWAKVVEDNIIPAINDAAGRNVNIEVKTY